MFYIEWFVTLAVELSALLQPSYLDLTRLLPMMGCSV